MTRAATVSVGEVIRDLPKLRSGLSKGDSNENWLKVVEQQQQKVIDILADCPDLEDVRYAVMDTQFLSDAPRSSRKKPDGRSHIKYADWYHERRLTETWNHEARGNMPRDLGPTGSEYGRARGGPSV